MFTAIRNESGAVMIDYIEKIKQERSRQDEKWGIQNHNPYFWLGILTEETGEVAKATIECNIESYEKELIETAAVALAALESLGRNHERDRRIFRDQSKSNYIFPK